jgi:hypothetical protein
MERPFSQITRARAERHEEVFLRLTRLLKQVDAMAVRRPEGLVSDALRQAAADVLFEAGRFRARAAKAPLVEPAPHLSGLAAQLGQAQARMEAFEIRHSFFEASQNCFIWATGPLLPYLPIKRLRAKYPVNAAATHDGELERKKQEFWRLIASQRDTYYDIGYEAGRAGAPHTYPDLYFRPDGPRSGRGAPTD